ncbi:MAG TPA: hypothetical protein VKH45_02980 [Candidatus Acidoferrum sp.]|nr:hypothetical protein [Candidatus Acidoferrum sp.]
MKRLTLVCFAMMFVTAVAIPQDSMNAQQVKVDQMAAEQQGNVPNALGLRTVVGCLSKTAGTYVITGGAPGPKQFRIVSGDVSSLKGKLGHTFKVVGIVGKNDALANQNGLYNEGSTTGVGYLTIEAQKISQVYVNCSEAGKEWAGDHK